MRPARPVLALALLGLALPLAAHATAADPDPTRTPVAQVYAVPFTDSSPRPTVPPLTGLDGGFSPYLGSMHEHSDYSDGYVPSTPETYYASGKRFGLDFMGGSDHSDFLGVPVSTSQYCAPAPAGAMDLTDPTTVVADEPGCLAGDPDPMRSLTKWDATKAYAREASGPTYTAFQGFEWSSDVYGHINVYFSKNVEDAKTTTPTTQTLYEWLQRRPELGGGSDGIFTFNHPGDKDITKPVRQQSQGLLPAETVRNWSDFAYDPRLDRQAVGIELYNSKKEYGTTHDVAEVPEGYYAHVLDKGWHVAPVGAEDLGHDHGDEWGSPDQAKTVMLATGDSAPELKAAMLARRVYAVRYGDVRLGLEVDGHIMGSRLTRPASAQLPVVARASWPGHTGLTLELVTNKGKVVATGTDALTANVQAAGSSYVFLRVKQGTEIVGYSAPVWVQGVKGGHTGEWLAGDLHVHTCYSHDAYCPRGDKGKGYFAKPIDLGPLGKVSLPALPAGDLLDTLGLGDYNTDLEDSYTLGGTVQERFAEASLKGLDYLAITDHHSDGNPEDDGSTSVHDPGFGSHEVVGVPGYENSISGHAQMLGAEHVYPAGTGTPGVQAMVDALHADGGVFQANHPADGIPHEMTSCSDTSRLMWGYGYDVKVDTVEIWNTNHFLQRPLPASAQNDDAVFFWECMLNRGWHVAATGGGDSHWMSVAAAQGVGNPTTWVFAQERSARGVLDALKQGRTSISLQSPLAGATQLLLEADADHDGVYESMIGDTVPPGTPMRVRALGTPGAGLVQVRANGATLLEDVPLTPGGTVDFTSPAKAGWVRATLYAPDAQAQRRVACDDEVGDRTTLCRYEVGALAMTSAIYLAFPPPPVVEPCDTRGRSDVCHPEHPQTPVADRSQAWGGRAVL